MKQLAIFIVFFLPAAGLALLISMMTRESEYQAQKVEKMAEIPFKPAPKGTLEKYGVVLESPLEDLRTLHILINDALKEVDGSAAEYCTNIQDVSKLMAGDNPLKQEFIPSDHRVFNTRGLLVDRWFRVLDVRFDVPDGFTLRSHGPDEQVDTVDDLYWPLP